MAEEQLRIDALEYHERPTPGKISIAPTKALANQRDLGLAYSPGVAYACLADAALLAMEGRFESFTLGRDVQPAWAKNDSRQQQSYGGRQPDAAA